MERLYAFLFFSLSVYLVGLSFFPGRIAYAVREDGPIESMTAIFAFLGAYLCIQIFILRKRHLRQDAYLLLLGALPFLFMGGEEISWGQRMLVFKPIISAGDTNYQREFTLHNFYQLDKFIYMGGFAFVAIVGGVLPVLSYFYLPVRDAYRKLRLPLMPVSVMSGMASGLILMVVARHYKPSAAAPFYFAWDVSYQLQEWREFYFCLMLFAYVFGDYFSLLKYHTAYGYRKTPAQT